MPRRFGGPAGYGFIPDPEGHRYTDARVMLARRGISDAAPTPAAVSWRKYGPPGGPFDQGPTSACTGNALAGAIYTTLGAQGAELPFVPSQDWTYKIGRALDRVPGQALTDSGAMPNQVLRGTAEFGVRPMGPRPADGRNSDVDPATVNLDPALGDLEVASGYELLGAYSITPADPNFVQKVRTSLAAGFCVTFTTYVDTVGPRSFENWDPTTGPLGAVVTPGDPAGGPHYLFSDGYETAPDGSTIIHIVNSWGATNWGVGGYGFGNEAFMRGMASVIVLNIRRAAAAA